MCEMCKKLLTVEEHVCEMGGDLLAFLDYWEINSNDFDSQISSLEFAVQFSQFRTLKFQSEKEKQNVRHH